MDTVNTLLFVAGNDVWYPGQLLCTFPIGVEESPALQLSFYPNPVLNTLTFNEKIDNAAYQLISIDGKILQSGRIANNTIQVNASLSPGIYYCVLQGDVVYAPLKWVKQ